MGKPCIQKTHDRKSTLTRSSNYRDNTPNQGPGDWRSHHVLCCMAVKSINVQSDYLHFVEDCLWITDWNINDADNLLSLPTKQQHVAQQGCSPANKPAHNVDHPIYNQDVCKWLKENVWDNVKMQQAPHTVDPKCIASDLKNCTKSFKAFLTAYGIRNGGTALSWKNRFDEEDTWFEPFSMAATPSPRHPGTKTSLADLFTKIGIA